MRMGMIMPGNTVAEDKSSEASAGICAGASVDLSPHGLPGISIRIPYFSLGARSCERAHDVNILNAGIDWRAARATFASAGVRARLSPLSAIWKQKDRLRRHRNKTSRRRSTIPGPGISARRGAIFHHRRIHLEAIRAQLECKRRALVDGQSKRQGRAPALEHGAGGTGSRFIDASLVGGQVRNLVSRLPDGGRAESDR